MKTIVFLLVALVLIIGVATAANACQPQRPSEERGFQAC